MQAVCLRKGRRTFPRQCALSVEDVVKDGFADHLGVDVYHDPNQKDQEDQHGDDDPEKDGAAVTAGAASDAAEASGVAPPAWPHPARDIASAAVRAKAVMCLKILPPV